MSRIRTRCGLNRDKQQQSKIKSRFRDADFLIRFSKRDTSQARHNINHAYKRNITDPNGSSCVFKKILDFNFTPLASRHGSLLIHK